VEAPETLHRATCYLPPWRTKLDTTVQIITVKAASVTFVAQGRQMQKFRIKQLCTGFSLPIALELISAIALFATCNLKPVFPELFRHVLACDKGIVHGPH